MSNLEMLLDILRCPACVSGESRRDNDDPGQLNLVNEKTWLICKEADCDRKYPVRSHIPVMLINEGDKWIQTPVQDLPHPDTLSD